MDNRVSGLLLDLYELTMAQCYRRYKSNTRATFDLFVRSLPKNRSYLMAAGLEDALNYVINLKFTREDLKFLSARKIFSPSFLSYLSRIKFSGDIWAMPEGTVFFPNEPIMRVSAPIIEAQIIESFLLNTINLQAMIATKAARVVNAACLVGAGFAPAARRGVYDFSLRRAHGMDAAIKVARSSYIAGFDGTSNALAAKLYNIPVVGTMAHSFVMSFKQEIDSFLAYSDTYPDKTILLVDTYNTEAGIANAIRAGLYLKKKRHRLLGIRLDSGDMVSLSNLAREKLDKAGLGYVKIFASGNLDEFKIERMLSRKMSVDHFGVGTHMGTSQDAPFLDVIYKISQITDEEGNFVPTMKLSADKATYPGRKQVYRVKDKKGRLVKDTLGLEGEKIKGIPLLIKVVDKGRLVYNIPSLDRIRRYAQDNLASLPDGLKAAYPKDEYPVIISPELEKLRQSLTLQLKKRQ